MFTIAFVLAGVVILFAGSYLALRSFLDGDERRTQKPQGQPLSK